MSGHGEWDREEFEKWWNTHGNDLLKLFMKEVDWRRLGRILR